MESKAVHDAPRCRRGHTEHGHTFVAHRGDLHTRGWNKADTGDALSNNANHITHGSTGDFPSNDAVNRAARVLIRTADAWFVDSQADPAPGTGHSLYMITWHRTHATKYNTWTNLKHGPMLGDGPQGTALNGSRCLQHRTLQTRHSFCVSCTTLYLGEPDGGPIRKGLTTNATYAQRSQSSWYGAPPLRQKSETATTA